MCGIVGFVGKHQAAPILLDGLSKQDIVACHHEHFVYFCSDI